jgi:anaerobic selenocysteine-containing dehydrogenase
MGFEDACFQETEDDMIRTLLASPHPFLKGITLEELERRGWIRLRVAEDGAPFLPFAEGGYGTADGKIHFRADFDYAPPQESRLGEAGLRKQFPLELISSKNDDSMNSTFGHRKEVDAQTSRLWMHVEDAAPRDIVDGDQVRVFNNRGSCLMRAQVNGGVRQGVVRAPSVRWAKRSLQGRGINVLTADRLTDVGGGPVFYSCLVEVEKCGD